MATKLHVSPWDYSAIRKNAQDKTEGEFIAWMLEKWPEIREHMYEEIAVVVDWGSGEVPTEEVIPPKNTYILAFRPSR